MKGTHSAGCTLVGAGGASISLQVPPCAMPAVLTRDVITGAAPTNKQFQPSFLSHSTNCNEANSQLEKGALFFSLMATC